MKRPLASKRPIGPFSQITGGDECVLRMQVEYRTRNQLTEATQSVERGIENEVGMTRDGLGQEVNVDNVAVIQGGSNRLEVRMDLPVKESNEDIEEEILSSLGIVLQEAGLDRATVNEVNYSVVAR